jgi:hypothetical protein
LVDKEVVVTFSDRLRTALAILARTGIRSIYYAPPTHRLLWRLGVEIRPPHFSGRMVNVLWVWPTFTAPILGLDLAFRDPSLMSLLKTAAFGLPYALTVALAYKGSADEHGLPAWADVESPDQPLHPPSTPSTNWLRDD